MKHPIEQQSEPVLHDLGRAFVPRPDLLATLTPRELEVLAAELFTISGPLTAHA